MKRDLIISALIAAAAHAGLLFGIPRSHAAPTLPGKACILDCFVTMPVEPLRLDCRVDDEPSDWNGARRPLFEQYAPVVSSMNFEMEISRAVSAGFVWHETVIGCPSLPLDQMAHIFHIGVFRVGDLDHVPLAQVKTRPAYPFEARRAGLSGEVVIEFEVDETGTVQTPRVASTSNRIFEGAALRAVAKWKFEPGKRGGAPVRFRMAVPIVFSLNSD